MTAKTLAPTERRMLTLPEAAEILGIGLRTLRCVIATGALPIVRPSPKRVVVDRRDLDRYIDERRS